MDENRLNARRLDKDHRRGLSTLETIVAVAILGVAMLPLIRFQGNLNTSYLRHDAAYERITLQRNALALLRDINPIAEPQGVRALSPEHQLNWSSQALSRTIPNVGHPAGDGPFTVALYRIDVLIADTSGRNIATFQFERLGWEK